jgi:hypothetical protein
MGNGGIDDGEECLAPGVTRAKSTRAEVHRRGGSGVEGGGGVLASDITRARSSYGGSSPVMIMVANDVGGWQYGRGTSGNERW